MPVFLKRFGATVTYGWVEAHRHGSRARLSRSLPFDMAFPSTSQAFGLYCPERLKHNIPMPCFTGAGMYNYVANSKNVG